MPNINSCSLATRRGRCCDCS